MATVPTRRTQEQRRAETRAKLLDATIQSLIEDGYAATTLRAVAARAGVSSGAMTHHYPRRVDLVGAAVEHLTEQRISALRWAVSQLPDDPSDRLGALLDLLWGDFSGPLFTVSVKLWIAADDDPELYERLVPLERSIARSIARAIADLADKLPPADDVEARVQIILAALRGLALTQSFEPRKRRRDVWAMVRPVLEQMVAGSIRLDDLGDHQRRL